MPIPTGQNVPFTALRSEVRAGTNNPAAVPGPLGIPLNDAQIRAFCFNPGPLPSTTQRSIGQARGVTFTRVVVSVNTSTYNMRDAVLAAGWPAAHRATTNCIINNGVNIYAPSVGAFSFNTGGGSWPASSTATVTVGTGASIVAKGGPAGDGGSAAGPAIPNAQWTAGGAGTGGGTAMNISLPTTIVNFGIIAGGGGGGGGGNGRRVAPAASGGGGGGGGASGFSTIGNAGQGGPGAPATVPQPGQNGTAGTFASPGGGTGGQNTPQPAPTRGGVGGNGGPWASSGQPGGQGGLPGTQGPGAGAGGSAGAAFNNTPSVTYTGPGQRFG